VHKLDTLYREYWDYPRSISPKDDLMAGVRSEALSMSEDHDVAQEVCLIVLEKIDLFVCSDASAFSRWVRSIVATSRARSAVNVQRRRENEYSDDAEYVMLAPPPFRDLDKVSASLRETAKLLMHGHSVEETAAILGVKPESVTKKVRRHVRFSPPFCD
jgi:DNA-directed RNA polymerase specialized sigma24 family protein